MQETTKFKKYKIIYSDLKLFNANIHNYFKFVRMLIINVKCFYFYVLVFFHLNNFYFL